MTDKEQIIINSVDVSECVHYEDLSCTAFRDSCGYPLDCKDFFFCNYKQLARKTQECEQKDERIIELTKEYQKLKEQKDKADKTISDLIGCVSLWEGFTEEESKLAKDSSIADLIMLLRKKAQEYEELKEKYKEYVNFHNYNDAEFKQERDSLMQEILYKKRYRKALEEIEEIVKNPCNLYEPTSQCIECVEGEILDIINKAKGEGCN